MIINAKNARENLLTILQTNKYHSIKDIANILGIKESEIINIYFENKITKKNDTKIRGVLNNVVNNTAD